MENITKEVLDNLQGTFATKKDVETQLEAYKAELSKTASSEDIAKLENILVEQGNRINDLSTPAEVPAADKSFYEQTISAIEANKEGFEGFKNKSKPFTFDLATKSAIMTIGTNVTGATALLPTPQLIAGYNPHRWNPATFLDYATLGTTNSARIAWVDEVNPTGTPGATAEGVQKPLLDVDNYVSVSDAVKIPAIMTISDEMLNDIPFMATQINNNLLNRVRLATSLNLYNYIDSVNGLTAVSASMADFGGAAANMWQLVVAAQQTIALSNHVCTHVFLNPTDYARLLLIKGDAQYPIIVEAGTMTINGVIIVSTNAMAAGSYMACDYSKLNTLVYKNLSVEMGWNGEDFTYNRRTFRGEWRLHRYIMRNDYNAFLIGSISADLLTLTV